VPRNSATNSASVSRSGRDQLLSAAIELVIERGIYRATSNEIARRAGVTWGAIQHYFGSRENLFVAVLERDFEFFLALMENAVIVGETPAERLGSAYDVIEAYYGRREYLATFQIRMSLLGDLKRAAETEQTVQRQNDGVNEGWFALVHRALTPIEIGSTSPLLVYEMFRAVASRRGLMAHYPESVRGNSAIDGLRTFTIDAVSSLLVQKNQAGRIG
jgi:AcrR family transcriptional regulator